MRLSPIDYKLYFKYHTLYKALVTDHEMNSDLPFGLLMDNLSELPEYLQSGMDSLLDSALLDDYSGRRISNAFASCYDIDFNSHTVADLYSSSELTRLMMQIFLKYHNKWQRLYDALYKAEYDPIANVDANETETYNDVKDELAIEGNENRTISMGGTDSHSISIGAQIDSFTHPTETVKNTEKLGASLSSGSGMGSQAVKEYSDIAGFNAVINPPQQEYPESSRVRREGTTATETETSFSGQDQVTKGARSDTDTITHSDSGSNNLAYQNRKNTNTKTGSITKTRHGNIGVTMTQQLIEAETELRNRWQFYNILIADVANELTLSIY